jgi:hypothetical protein
MWWRAMPPAPMNPTRMFFLDLGLAFAFALGIAFAPFERTAEFLFFAN